MEGVEIEMGDNPSYVDIDKKLDGVMRKLDEKPSRASVDDLQQNQADAAWKKHQNAEKRRIFFIALVVMLSAGFVFGIMYAISDGAAKNNVQIKTQGDSITDANGNQLVVEQKSWETTTTPKQVNLMTLEELTSIKVVSLMDAHGNVHSFHEASFVKNLDGTVTMTAAGGETIFIDGDTWHVSGGDPSTNTRRGFGGSWWTRFNEDNEEEEEEEDEDDDEIDCNSNFLTSVMRDLCKGCIVVESDADISEHDDDDSDDTSCPMIWKGFKCQEEEEEEEEEEEDNRWWKKNKNKNTKSPRDCKKWKWVPSCKDQTDQEGECDKWGWAGSKCKSASDSTSTIRKCEKWWKIHKCNGKNKTCETTPDLPTCSTNPIHAAVQFVPDLILLEADPTTGIYRIPNNVYQTTVPITPTASQHIFSNFTNIVDEGSLNVFLPSGNFLSLLTQEDESVHVTLSADGPPQQFPPLPGFADIERIGVQINQTHVSVVVTLKNGAPPVSIVNTVLRPVCEVTNGNPPNIQSSLMSMDYKVECDNSQCQCLHPAEFVPETQGCICSSGHFWNALDKICVECQPGTFNPSTTSGGSCEACHPGTFTSTQGNTECEPCPAGTSASSTGSIECVSDAVCSADTLYSVVEFNNELVNLVPDPTTHQYSITDTGKKYWLSRGTSRVTFTDIQNPTNGNPRTSLTLHLGDGRIVRFTHEGDNTVTLKLPGQMGQSWSGIQLDDVVSFTVTRSDYQIIATVELSTQTSPTLSVEHIYPNFVDSCRMLLPPHVELTRSMPPVQMSTDCTDCPNICAWPEVYLGESPDDPCTCAPGYELRDLNGVEACRPLPEPPCGCNAQPLETNFDYELESDSITNKYSLGSGVVHTLYTGTHALELTDLSPQQGGESFHILVKWTASTSVFVGYDNTNNLQQLTVSINANSQTYTGTEFSTVESIQFSKSATATTTTTSVTITFNNNRASITESLTELSAIGGPGWSRCSTGIVTQTIELTDVSAQMGTTCEDCPNVCVWPKIDDPTDPLLPCLCAPGHPAAASGQCTACDPGTFDGGDGNGCQDCFDNTFTSTYGNVECQWCPSGTSVFDNRTGCAVTCVAPFQESGDNSGQCECIEGYEAVFDGTMITSCKLQVTPVPPCGCNIDPLERVEGTGPEELHVDPTTNQYPVLDGYFHRLLPGTTQVTFSDLQIPAGDTRTKIIEVILGNNYRSRLTVYRESVRLQLFRPTEYGGESYYENIIWQDVDVGRLWSFTVTLADSVLSAVVATDTDTVAHAVEYETSDDTDSCSQVGNILTTRITRFSARMSTTCTACPTSICFWPEAYVEDDYEASCICVPGYSLQDSGCEPCGIGTFSIGGSTSCQPCDPGLVAPVAGLSECIACSVGVPNTDATECVPVAANPCQSVVCEDGCACQFDNQQPWLPTCGVKSSVIECGNGCAEGFQCRHNGAAGGVECSALCDPGFEDFGNGCEELTCQDVICPANQVCRKEQNSIAVCGIQTCDDLNCPPNQICKRRTDGSPFCDFDNGGGFFDNGGGFRREAPVPNYAAVCQKERCTGSRVCLLEFNIDDQARRALGQESICPICGECPYGQIFDTNSGTCVELECTDVVCPSEGACECQRIDTAGFGLPDPPSCQNEDLPLKCPSKCQVGEKCRLNATTGQPYCAGECEVSGQIDFGNGCQPLTCNNVVCQSGSTCQDGQCRDIGLTEPLGVCTHTECGQFEQCSVKQLSRRATVDPLDSCNVECNCIEGYSRHLESQGCVLVPSCRDIICPGNCQCELSLVPGGGIGEPECGAGAVADIRTCKGGCPPGSSCGFNTTTGEPTCLPDCQAGWGRFENSGECEVLSCTDIICYIEGSICVIGKTGGAVCSYKDRPTDNFVVCDGERCGGGSECTLPDTGTCPACVVPAPSCEPSTAPYCPLMEENFPVRPGNIPDLLCTKTALNSLGVSTITMSSCFDNEPTVDFYDNTWNRFEFGETTEVKIDLTVPRESMLTSVKVRVLSPGGREVPIDAGVLLIGSQFASSPFTGNTQLASISYGKGVFRDGGLIFLDRLEVKGNPNMITDLPLPSTTFKPISLDMRPNCPLNLTNDDFEYLSNPTNECVDCQSQTTLSVSVTNNDVGLPPLFVDIAVRFENEAFCQCQEGFERDPAGSGECVEKPPPTCRDFACSDGCGCLMTPDGSICIGNSGTDSTDLQVHCEGGCAEDQQCVVDSDTGSPECMTRTPTCWDIICSEGFECKESEDTDSISCELEDENQGRRAAAPAFPSIAFCSNTCEEGEQCTPSIDGSPCISCVAPPPPCASPIAIICEPGYKDFGDGSCVLLSCANIICPEESTCNQLAGNNAIPTCDVSGSKGGDIVPYEHVCNELCDGGNNFECSLPVEGSNCPECTLQAAGCPLPKIYDSQQKKCICPDGYNLVDDQCICPDGYNLVDDQCVLIEDCRVGGETCGGTQSCCLGFACFTTSGTNTGTCAQFP